jgi:hypothetical protein
MSLPNIGVFLLILFLSVTNISLRKFIVLRFSSLGGRIIKRWIRNGKHDRVSNRRVREGNGILFRVLKTSINTETPTDEKDTVDCPNSLETSGM